MSIPLDRLYSYIERQAKQIWHSHVLIYRFYPHGSKDFEDLAFLNDEHDTDNILLCPHIYCNDQEPLNWALYETSTNFGPAAHEFVQKLGLSKQNFRDYPIDIWDWSLLLHSEQGGKNLACYQADGFLPVYYWSHAVLAKDWFRFAEKIVQQKQPSPKIFLIYNRAWGGTREYRLKFADLLIQHNLVDQCRTWANSYDVEGGLHYLQHTFDNDQWRPHRQLENYFEPSSASSTNSADFDLSDYEASQIEVVLETLFDDDRVHLTEKTLRPIALGQPFILAGTVGSLAYLQRYGFKTFDSVWSESYDQINDAQDRLNLVINVMKQIAMWSPQQRNRAMILAQEIADYNKKRFFSPEFEQQILNELNSNMTRAFNKLKTENTSARWMRWHDIRSTLTDQQLQDLKENLLLVDQQKSFKFFTDQNWEKFLPQVKKY